MRVEWSDCARDDIDELVHFINRDSEYYEQRFGEKVVLDTWKLKKYPESGRMIPKAEDATLQDIPVSKRQK